MPASPGPIDRASGKPAAPHPPALLRRLRRVLKAMESEPCQCPLEAARGTSARPADAPPGKPKRSWEKLCYTIERGNELGPMALLPSVVVNTEACFCATCHDHRVPSHTWLWLMEQARPEEMAGPPEPLPAAMELETGSESEAKAARLALYEQRAAAGRSLFHKADKFVIATQLEAC